MTEPTTHSTPSTQALQKAVLAMPMARTPVSYTHLTLPTNREV